MEKPETLLVRLRPHDSKQKCVLRRYVYRGIHFMAGDPWTRVPKDVGDYLRAVRQKDFDTYSPPAFEVCTDAEAKAKDAQQRRDATAPQNSVTAIHLTLPRADAGNDEADDAETSTGRRRRQGARAS